MEKKEEYALQWQRAHEIFDKVMAEFNQNEADGGGINELNFIFLKKLQYSEISKNKKI
jgi:hypothetical protein